MNYTFRDDLWIKQELAKVTEANVTERYLAYQSDFRKIGGDHRKELIRQIKAKFPHKFSGGSR